MLQDHDNILREFFEQSKELFDNSEQGIYVYLDDTHKMCNDKFSSLLGYSSPTEWASVRESFPNAFVADDSQETLVSTYQNAVENLVGSDIPVTWKKKTGETVKTEVILVPMVYKEHVLALHFIQP